MSRKKSRPQKRTPVAGAPAPSSEALSQAAVAKPSTGGNAAAKTLWAFPPWAPPLILWAVLAAVVVVGMMLLPVFVQSYIARLPENYDARARELAAQGDAAGALDLLAAETDREIYNFKAFYRAAEIAVTHGDGDDCRRAFDGLMTAFERFEAVRGRDVHTQSWNEAQGTMLMALCLARMGRLSEAAQLSAAASDLDPIRAARTMRGWGGVYPDLARRLYAVPPLAIPGDIVAARDAGTTAIVGLDPDLARDSTVLLFDASVDGALPNLEGSPREPLQEIDLDDPSADEEGDGKVGDGPVDKIRGAFYANPYGDEFYLVDAESSPTRKLRDIFFSRRAIIRLDPAAAQADIQTGGSNGVRPGDRVILRLTARATPAFDAWPVLLIRAPLNSKSGAGASYRALGAVAIRQSAERVYEVGPFRLPEGIVEIAYLNDEYDGELKLDRNFGLRRVELLPAEQ